MEDGKVLTLDEAEVMEAAQAATERMLDRAGLRDLLRTPDSAWRGAHYAGRLPVPPAAAA